MLKKLKKEQ